NARRRWQRAELEHPSALGRLLRMVQVDLVDEADEPVAERDPAGPGSQHVAEELDALRRVQLSRAKLLAPISHRDRRTARGTQVADPVHLAPRSPDPAPV